MTERPRAWTGFVPWPHDAHGTVQLADVVHRYGRGGEDVTVVGPLDLSVTAGEFLVLVGPSGCGKSTLLHLIAGFERPTRGTARVSGDEPTPGAVAGAVFQTPRLFPWRTVGGNVDLALRYAGVDRAHRPERRARLLSRVGLEGAENRRTWEIPGGQQQRVALARALAAEHPLLLLDEPFAALDALTRERLQEDVRRVTAQTGRTTVFVTHSAEEAVFLGSRIVVLAKGPGTVALDLPIDLPRGDIDAEELRESREFADLRTRISHAVKTAAAG
ncbi:ABC transporter ATP-binding protein [Streptomyces sp. W4I9-2]|uniref:ABC transporter ATP-binding protein n=1 Tax=Streptomyces sp. W4I9-2 TaxID=3042297 RepID=UPI002783DCEC|nr:ATP-binding cassette domain-containing protein [Streptomyces sp. W4I9-2]MDQ0693761.1 taurine transport system ATP-binding protein [Streptomyces sp. W4I9-2]